jgi:hypothetical protein
MYLNAPVSSNVAGWKLPYLCYPAIHLQFGDFPATLGYQPGLPDPTSGLDPFCKRLQHTWENRQIQKNIPYPN